MYRFFMDHGDRKFSPLAIAAFIVGGIILAAAFALVFGWIVLLLWNWLMPAIFGLPRIGYWQAWGLVLLSHILMKGGFGPHGHGPHGWRHGHPGWKAELRTHFRDASRGNGTGRPTSGDAGDSPEGAAGQTV